MQNHATWCSGLALAVVVLVGCAAPVDHELDAQLGFDGAAADAQPDSIADGSPVDSRPFDPSDPDASVVCERSGSRDECRLCSGTCFETHGWACLDGVCRFYCNSCVDPGFVHCGSGGVTDAGTCAPPG